MRFLVTGIFVLFFYNAFAVYFLSAPRVSASQPTSQVNLSSYFAQKGKGEAKNNEFASLLTNPDILGITSTSPSPSPSLTTNYKLPTTNSTYTIALLGDSMVDTLGSDLPDLKQELARRLPAIKFTLLNYGVGASNIESGLGRLTQGYSYLGETKPSLLSQNPDIVVVESFAYNHWGDTQSDLDRHWLALAKVIETIKNHDPNTKIVLAATVAPHCPTYTDGSANLPQPRKQQECEMVKAYLQNLVNFATSQRYPLADVYHPSLSGSDGNPKYINQGDHIHPSDAGKKLFSQKVAETIGKVNLGG